MFSLLWTLFIGLIIGAVAKLLMPGKDPGGVDRDNSAGHRGLVRGVVSGPRAGLVSGRAVGRLHHVGARSDPASLFVSLIDRQEKGLSFANSLWGNL